MKKQLIGVGVAALMFGGVVSASATMMTIDFDHGTAISASVYAESGFTISTTASDLHLHSHSNYFDITGDSIHPVGDLKIVKTDGSAFSLFSLRQWSGNESNVRAITNSGTVFNFRMTDGNGYTPSVIQNFNSAFSNITSVIFTYSAAFNNGWGIDDIRVDDLYVAPPPPPTPTPEPATMLLFGTGLVGLVGSKIRKKKKQQ